MKKITGVIFCLSALLIASVLYGAQKIVFADQSQRLKTEPLALNPVIDPFLIRFDVFRGSHPVNKANSKGEVYQDYESNLYAHAALSFGNVLIMDLNNNIALDLAAYLGLYNKQNFKLLYKSRATKITIVRDATNFTVTGTEKNTTLAGIFKQEYLKVFNNKKKMTTEVRQNPNGIIYNESDNKSTRSFTMDRGSDGTISFPINLGGHVPFKITDPHQIKLAGADINDMGDRIEFVYQGYRGFKPAQLTNTFIFTATGISMYTYHGVSEIRKTAAGCQILFKNKVVGTIEIQ